MTNHQNNDSQNKPNHNAAPVQGSGTVTPSSLPPFGTTNPNPAPTPSPVVTPPRPTTSDVLKPGFTDARGPQQDPDSARKIIESRSAPSNIYVPPTTGPVALQAGNASNTVQGPASIAELARALENNPQLIYEFVANNIEFTPTFGLQKGGYGALVDGFGNSFDQSDLMVQLLTQAGITAKYVLGQVRLYVADWTAWLGTDTNPWSAANLLSNGGIANTVTWDSVHSVYYIDVSHMWVQATISGTNYVFDPARKNYTYTTGINLATALGYSQSTFLSDASSGATITADYAQNMNRTNLRNDLKAYSMNLVNWIRTNMPTARVDDILGGRSINGVTIPLLQTTLSYEKPGDTPTVYTAIPSQYKTTLQVQYDWNGTAYNIDKTFYSSDIHGQRLSLFFNASNQAQLALNGTVLATSSAQGVGTYNSVLLTATHPYGSTFANQSVWHTVYEGASYIIANAWGMANDGMVGVHERTMLINSMAGNLDVAESVLGEALEIIWHTWSAEKCRTADLLGRMSTSMTVFHHQIGLVSQLSGGATTTDLGMIMWTGSALDNNYDHVNTCRTALAMHGIAYETLVQQERALVGGVSSTPIVDLAVQAGQKIYTAKSSNWSSNVKPNLTGYAASDLTNIENWYINNGWNVVIPQSGSITKNLWTGFGYLAVPITPYSGTVGIISGTLKGGSSDTECGSGFAFARARPQPRAGGCSSKKKTTEDSIELKPLTPKLDTVPTKTLSGGVSQSQGSGGTSSSSGSGGAGGGGGGAGPEGGPGPGGDPITPANGAFTHHHSDISIGSRPFPYSLSFETSYASTNRLNDSPLGLGWSHSFMIGASTKSSSMRGLGQLLVIDAAAAITEMFVSIDLLTDLTRPLNKYLSVSLANQWLVDQLTNNLAEFSGTNDLGFVKLPDGSFNPPPRSAASVTLSGSTYTYKSPQGVVMNFNSDGTLSTMVFPYGVTVSLSYTSGLLTSISNGLGRTLTLGYTGTRLTSVSDGTGRSVSYNIDSNGNLTSFTNTLGKSVTYSYDLPGRLTQIFLPANPTTAVVTNVYDTLDRVKTQANALNQTFTIYCAGSRTKFVDAAGSAVTTYWNNLALALKTTDALNNSQVCTYDGLYRTAKVTAPEGNSSSMTYDAKNNLLQITKAPKPGSSLPNLVWTMTYDAVWNKVKTLSNPLLNVTTFNYDPTTGNLLSVLSPVIGGQTPTNSFTYNARGQLLTQTDPTGIVTQYNYDSATEKLTSIVVDYGTSPHLNLTTQFGYDAVGNMTAVTNPRGYQTTFQYNATRRMTQKTDPAPFSYVTSVGYDDNGQVKSIQRQTGGTPAWQIYSYTYSLSGQKKSITDPSGKVTTWNYDSADRVQNITDADSRVWQYAYDALNRVSQVTDPSNTISQTNGYSANGLLNSIKDARNNTTTMTFDGFDRPDKTIFADSTYQENVSYDATGNVLTFRTRSGNTVTATYDVLNRLSTKSPQGQATTTYSFDLAGRLTQVSKPVVSGDPSTGALQFFFDTAGRFYKEQYPDGKTVVHVLDNNGNRTKTTWPDSYYVTRAFDQLDRLTDIYLNGSTGSAAHFAYDQLSRRSGITLGNGASISYSPQLNDDLTNLSHNFVGSSVAFTLGYNNTHQISSNTVSDGSYMWHPAAAGSTSYGTADSVNKYPSVGGSSYSYDGNGNLTGDGTWSFGYDTENHLISASATGTTASYVYDPTHRQSQKTVGSVKTRMVYDGARLIATYDGTSGALQNRYVHGPGADEVLIQVTASGTVSFFHHDFQNSVIAISNNTGSVVNQYSYSSFGESTSLSGTIFGFTGQRIDSETGLYYYKARYYSAKLGRFLQPDPIGYGGGSLNLYEYATNDPLNKTDPTGLVPLPQDPIPVGGGGIQLIPGSVQENVTNGGTGSTAINKAVDFGTALVARFPGLDIFTPGLKNLTNPVFVMQIVWTALGGLLAEWTFGAGVAIAAGAVPVYELDAQLFPKVAENVKFAIANGHPDLLHYVYGINKLNRKEALDGLQGILRGTGKSLDEFPFASTIEGGSGSHISVVSLIENSAQGRDFLKFLRESGILKQGYGTFQIKIINMQ